MSTLDQAPKSQRMRRKKWIEIALVGVIAAYLAATFAWRTSGAPPYFIVVVLAAILSVLSFLLFAAMDEVEKQTHLSAWFWGGSAGLCVTAAIILALVPTVVEPGGWRSEDPSRALIFMAGLGLGLVPPTLGYLVGLVVLWLRQR